MASTTTCNKEGSNVAVATNSATNHLCVLEKLTSSFYGVHNPPKDWADASLLIPHEAIRRELSAMCRSIDELVRVNETASNANENEKKETHKEAIEGWKAVYFCEWFSGPFAEIIQEHHDNEEEIYFPWIKTRVDLAQWDASKLSHGHADLTEKISSAITLCGRIIANKGEKCSAELSQLKVQLHELEDFMIEHLAEEERDIPPLLRANFTQQEEDETVQVILKKAGLKGMRNFLPSILLAMQEWASPAFYEKFFISIPGPIRHLGSNYFIPDYENCIAAKRDAPFWEPSAKNHHQKRPLLKRTKCCRISFCFPCLI